MEIADIPATAEKRDFQKATVELRVKGDQLLPDAVTRATGLAPSRAWSKGQEYEARRSAQLLRKSTGLWVISQGSDRLEDAALQLLNVVESRVDSFRRVAQEFDAQISIAISWRPDSGEGGFFITSSVMLRLASLGESMDFYFFQATP